MQPVFTSQGKSCFEGIWTDITAARSFAKCLLDVPKEATHWVRYTSGATAALQVGETLTGGTSGSTCKIVAIAVENGTAGSSDSGILLLSNPSGAFQAETLTGGSSTGTVAIAQALIPITFSGSPKAAEIAIETASVTYTTSGLTPTIAAGTNYGKQLPAASFTNINDPSNVRNFTAINTVASSGAVLKYTLNF